MKQETYDRVLRHLDIAKDALAELPRADANSGERLRKQVALALDSIAALLPQPKST